MTESDFKSLLAAARAGSTEAVQRLAEKYEPALRVVARVRLGPQLRPYLDSMDLVQSVHRSVIVGLRNDKFDISSPDHLMALARTIVFRKITRNWRKLQRQNRSLDVSSDADELSVAIASLSLPDDDPINIASRRETLAKALQKMKPMERKLVQARLNGCSTADAARQLDVDPNVARVLLNRMRHRLTKAGMVGDLL